MSQQLVHIIQSLGKSEKRYVHLHLKTFSGSDNLLLHDFLELEKSLVKKKHEPKIKGNSTRLYYKLLDILVEYHRENLNNNNIDYINLNRAKLLFHKGFMEEAEKIIDKILEIPSDINHLIKVEAIELRLLNAVNHGQTSYLTTHFETDKARLKTISDEYTNLINYELLWAASKYENSSTYFFENRNNYSETQYSEYLSHEDQAKSPLAKILFNKIKGYEAVKSRDIDLAIKYTKRGIDIFEENPNLIKTNTIEYLKSIRNYCIALNHKKMIKEAKAFLIETQSKINPTVLQKNIATKIEAYTLFSLIRIDLIINSRILQERSSVIEESEKQFIELREHLPKDELMSASYQFIIFYLSGANPRKSIRYINYIIKQNDETRKDLKELSLISELAVHYKLGNIELLESKLNTFKKYLQRNEVVFGFSNNIPSYFNKLIRNPEDNKLYKSIIEEIQENLKNENKEFYSNFIPLVYLRN